MRTTSDRFRCVWQACALILAFMMASHQWALGQSSAPGESISYGYNLKESAYYRYALKEKLLYYLNKQSQWVKVNAPSFPASYGFISISFDKNGRTAIHALGSDGYLYVLKHSSSTSAYSWEKPGDVQPLAAAPSSLVYFYNPKEDRWVNRALVNGHFYLLNSNDKGKTWAWEENKGVPSLSGDQVCITGGYDRKGNGVLYALSAGKLCFLKTDDAGKTWYWKELKDVEPLSGAPAPITFYYDQHNRFLMFAMQGGQEYQLSRDTKSKTWQWVKTKTPVLQ